jgi:hypothetical protein
MWVNVKYIAENTITTTTKICWCWTTGDWIVWKVQRNSGEISQGRFCQGLSVRSICCKLQRICSGKFMQTAFKIIHNEFLDIYVLPTFLVVIICVIFCYWLMHALFKSDESQLWNCMSCLFHQDAGGLRLLCTSLCNCRIACDGFSSSLFVSKDWFTQKICVDITKNKVVAGSAVDNVCCRG